jgi:hypothetical protein
VLVTATNALGSASAEPSYQWPVEPPGGVGWLTNLATAERQVRQAAGLGVSLASLLKNRGYTVSFLFQATAPLQADVLQVSWTAVPSPGARPVRVAWLLSKTVASPFGGSLTRRLKVKVKLTAQGRGLLQDDNHLVVEITSIFEQLNSENGLYPVEFTASRSL